jgi:hypothetical protein
VLLGWAFGGRFRFALRAAAVPACPGHVAGSAEGAQVEAGVVSAAFDVVHVRGFPAAQDARVVVSFEDPAPQGRPVRWEFFAAP